MAMSRQELLKRYEQRQEREAAYKNNPIATRSVDQVIEQWYRDQRYATFKTVGDWVNANEAYLNVINDYNNKINNGEWLSIEDRKNYRKAIDAYIETANVIRSANTKYGAGYTAEEEQEWNNSVASMNQGFTDVDNFYNNFASDKVYGDWMAQKEADEAYNAYFSDIDVEKAAQGWQEYLAAEEAAKNATRNDLNKNGKDDWWEDILWWTFGSGSSGGIVDTTLPNAGVTQTIHDLRADNSHLRPNETWSEDQKNVFGQLYAESPYLAYSFAEETNNRNSKAKEKAAIKKLQESATSSFGAGFGHTIGAIAASPLKLADFLGDLAYANAGRDITDDGSITPGEYSDAVTGGISTRLNEYGTLDESVPIFGGKGWGDLYGHATSTVQSIVSGYTLGAAGTLVSYMGQGATSAMESAIARGVDDGWAALYGVVIGAIEGVAESMGVDNLFKLGSASTFKGLLKNVVKQAGSEGLEEGITAILSNVADAWMLQDNSNFAYQIAAYKNLGYSESYAKEKVFWDSIGGIAFDMISGAASGMVSGGVQTGLQTIGASVNAKKTYGNNIQDLLIESAEIGGNTALVDKLIDKYGKKGTLSGYDLYSLVETNDVAIRSGDKTAIVNYLTKLGEGGNVGKVADIVLKKVTGEELTAKEESILAKSKYGNEVADKIDANEIGTGNLASELSALEVPTDSVKQTAVPKSEATPDLNEATEYKALKSDVDLVKQIATERVGNIEGWTEEVSSAMIKGYDERVSPTEYATAFQDAFNMGANNVPASKLVGVINSGVSERVAYTAYALGKQKNVGTVLKSVPRNGIINTNTSEANNERRESIHLRDGGKRDGSKDTQRQISRVEGGTGEAENRGENNRVADSEAARLVNEGREVKVSDLGILGGSTEHSVRVVSKDNEISSMKEAREKAEASGLKVTFFVGDNLVIKDKNGKWISARGYIKGKHVFIRGDHPLYTADQLMRHELGHDMIAKGEIDINKVRERIKQILQTDEGIDEAAKHYEEAYSGSGYTADEIWEEMICDSLADMNIFSKTTSAESAEVMSTAIPAIRQAVSETKTEATKTDAQVEGKASRETFWYPDLTQKEWDLLNYRLNREFETSDNFIDKATKWLYADSRGTTVFAIYGIGDGTEATVLYAVGGAKAQNMNARREEYEANINGAKRNAYKKNLERLGVEQNQYGNGANRNRQDVAQTDSGVGSVSSGEQRGHNGEAVPSDSTQGVVSKYASPEEAKISGEISDAKFSIEFADDIANKQRKYEADGLSMISSAELEQAISDTARMVEEMKPYANILPQDKVGKTLVKNGSYDVSVENTTVCIRTLAYNSFVDMVSEKVGRPLTQMESFLVSQKLYEIAKEPQCLYCYVSLDRKAFNEMVIRYTEQRDEAIKAYEKAGKPKVPASFNAEWGLFKEFLDGRKPTKNMWDRYVGWLNAYNKGERLVSLADISTEAKRLELVEAGGEMASQVKDMLKYAQSASWAKKQTQYVAYYDEILKLKPAVIRNLNSHYGMRWYSFSDYSGAFIVENMQQITDAAIRGLKGLSYTKDTDFAEIFAPTGMNINISVYAKKGENGYEIDAKQSANIDEAIKLRNQYPNVGIVVVATDAKGVEWALEQEWSDVVIPFHTVRTGADVAEFYNWEIFNAEQSDTVADQNLWDAYVNSVGKKKASKMVYPSEHQNNKDTYLRIINERGLKPRFSSFLDNPNYMKLVNETRQSEWQTQPLKPNYNLDAALRSFDKFVEKGGYYEGWYNDGIDVDNEADIVASDVRAGKKANEVDYGRQDINFDDVAKSRKTNRQHGNASMELDLDYDENIEATKTLTNRDILVNALESATTSQDELDNLRKYKKNIEQLNKKNFVLGKLKEEIKAMSFGKGQRDTAKLAELKEKAAKLERTINYYDSQLVRLEAMKPVRDLVQRERAKAYKKAAEKGREALRRNVEGRHKTEIRHKIQRVARELDLLLNKGTKQRNVKNGEAEIVRRALDLSEMLFATDDELVVRGLDVDLSDAEAEALVEYKKIYEEYHSYDDAVTENKARRAELRSIMNEIKRGFADALERERKRISKAKASASFDALINAYKTLADAKEDYLKLAYKPEVVKYIEALKANVGETLVSEMTLEQLESVYKAFKMIKETVTNSNKLWRDGKRESMEERRDAIFGQIGGLKNRFSKDYHEFVGKALAKINEFGWNNLRPVDAFELIGSDALSELFWDVIGAQSVYAKDIEEVKAAIIKARQKYGYKGWDINKTKSFKMPDGRTFTVTLGEMMSIYAYSKRDQADAHMRDGGFQHAKGATYKDGKVVKLRSNKHLTYKVDDKLRFEIINSLTAEQKAYAAEIQELLTAWGEKGNEASRILYGIDLFNEEVYFPLKSSHDYIDSVQTEIGQTATTASLAGSGMAKPTKPNADNPIILQAFDDVVLEHFDRMSKYHAYVVPIENLRKMLDAQSIDDSKNMLSIKALIGEKLGDGASEYLKNYITDLNGSASISGAKNPLESFFGKSKAAAVAANLSVWVQQYFSVIRAFSEVNPRYFIPFMGEQHTKGDMKAYEEMKKYAPIATIKEMGGFDVGSSRGIKDYVGYEEANIIKTKGKISKKVQDLYGSGANLMDRLGWITIWKGIKKEVAASGKYKVGSEEYFNACGKRFEEVIVKTQVYDSVNARSGYMRSKSGTVKYLVSFMGEPTTIVGMAEVAVIKLERAIASKDKVAIRKATAALTATMASIAISTAMTSIAKSLVYAMRDDDEDETYFEKYMEALIGAFKDDVNLLNYFPVARDIVSIFEGRTIERPDMTLLADAIDSLLDFWDSVYDGDSSEEIASDAFALAGSIANILGHPMKNIWRDLKALYNTIINTNN